MAKSIAKNALYSGIRTVCSMVFPLITYPYAARVLLQDNLGKVSFAQSIVSYFALIAALGVSTYAVREGAGYRENREKIDEFGSQIFTINMVSTVIAYGLLLLLTLVWPWLQGYLALIAGQSVSIIGTTIGVDWVYNIYEDYGYITARTIVVQVISAVLLFVLVHQPNDYVVYAGITVFANVGANIFNFIRARRYVTLCLTWKFDPKRHLGPIFVLFGNAVAITIYVNTDVTILGIMRTDAEVGLYSVAVKVYTIIKSLLNALVTVSLPRLSLFKSNGCAEEYSDLLTTILRGLLVTMLPVLAMLFLMAHYVIAIVGGAGYEASVVPLRILCFAAVPSLLAAYVTTSILLPNHREDCVLKSTLVGAFVNFALNLVFIPWLGMVGAAITTLIAEALVLGVSACYAKGCCKLSGVGAAIMTAMVAIVVMTAIYLLVQGVLGFSVVGFCVSATVLLASYVAVLLLRKDELAMRFLGGLHANRNQR